MRGIEAQFLALQKGFNEIIPQHMLRPFDEKELEVSNLEFRLITIFKLTRLTVCIKDHNTD